MPLPNLAHLLLRPPKLFLGVSDCHVDFTEEDREEVSKIQPLSNEVDQTVRGWLRVFEIILTVLKRLEYPHFVSLLDQMKFLGWIVHFVSIDFTMMRRTK